MKIATWLLLLAATPLLSACSTVNYLNSLDSHIEETNDFIRDRKAGWAKIEKKEIYINKKNQEIYCLYLYNVREVQMKTMVTVKDKDEYEEYKVGDQFPIFVTEVVGRHYGEMARGMEKRNLFDCGALCLNLWRDITRPFKILYKISAPSE